MGREYESRQAGIGFYYGYVCSLNFKKYSQSVSNFIITTLFHFPGVLGKMDCIQLRIRYSSFLFEKVSAHETEWPERTCMDYDLQCFICPGNCTNFMSPPYLFNMTKSFKYDSTSRGAKVKKVCYTKKVDFGPRCILHLASTQNVFRQESVSNRQTDGHDQFYYLPASRSIKIDPGSSTTPYT